MNNDSEKKTETLKLSSKKLTLGGKSEQPSVGFVRGSQASNVQVEVRKKRRHFSSSDSDNNTKANNSSSSNAKDVNSKNNFVEGGLTEGERNTRLKVLMAAAENEKKKELERAALEDKNLKEEILVQEQQAQEELSKIEEKLEIGAKEELIIESIPLPKNTEETKIVAQEALILAKPKIAETSDESEYNKRNPLVRPIKSNEKITKEKPKKFDTAELERPTKVVRDDSKRKSSNKLTIAQALSIEESRTRSLASVRRAREKAKRSIEMQVKDKIVREVIVPEVITVQELANRMAERAVDVTKALMKMGMIVTASQSIDADTAEIVVGEFGHKIKRVQASDIEDILKDEVENDDLLESRPPVVTFMGHVDHGKTSLLDAIRQASVAKGEAGGITQHIGAYQITTESGEKITFLDTPGHEAFTEMRKRGANATDVVVLVVAADDGIMAQTIEAINHAKAASVPIIVAINKIDKPEANSLKVRNALLEYGIVSEDFGGDTLCVDVSAKKFMNLDKLQEAILLQAEIQDLKANANRTARGVVIEARLDKLKGVVATILVQKGTLNNGDLVVVGSSYGRVKTMSDSYGKKVDKAIPSMPVEVLGLNDTPEAGSLVAEVDSEKLARDIVEYRIKKAKDLKVAREVKGSLEELFLQAREGGVKELNVIIKADVHGSVEAIVASLNKLSTAEVAVRILHSAVGGIVESDISLASASRALVLGFNVRADAGAKTLSTKDDVKIFYYSVIYNLIDEVRAIMGGMLTPEKKEIYHGNVEIRDVFNITRKGKVAGCFVTEGLIKKTSKVRLLRDNIVIYEGSLKALKRFKDDVKEVAGNFECGISFENYEDIKVGDVIEAFEIIEEKRSL